jgi:hypothetical protein
MFTHLKTLFRGGRIRPPFRCYVGVEAGNAIRPSAGSAITAKLPDFRWIFEFAPVNDPA